MPGQMGGLSPIRTAHHFKRTYVSASIEYSVEPVNHASAQRADAWGRGLVVPAYSKGHSLNYSKIFLLRENARISEREGA